MAISLKQAAPSGIQRRRMPTPLTVSPQEIKIILEMDAK
jgi:hypothetical protein